MGTALITGASSGLGLEMARLFARDGHSLILAARRRALLEQAAKELSEVGPGIRVEVLDIDLGVPDAGTVLFSKVQKLGLRVDFLVNNAGFGSSGEFAQLPLAKELQMIDLNVRTLVELTRLFLPQMIERGEGRVLNVGSMAGFQPGPYMATYYATKAFVNSFSEALHEELRGTGVTCTVLAPGATATEFARSAGAEGSTLFQQSKLVASSAEVAASGYRAMMSGCVLAIPGLLNRIQMQGLRFFPRSVIRKIASKVNQ